MRPIHREKKKQSMKTDSGRPYKLDLVDKDIKASFV